MENNQLEQIRIALCLSVPDCLLVVSEVTGNKINRRTWEKYETGELRIPKEVLHVVQSLIQKRSAMIKVRSYHGFFRTFSEYQKNTGDDDLIHFKLSRSINAERTLKAFT